MKKVYSISLSENRIKELAFLYAALSILENEKDLKLIKVIDKALETTNRIIVEKYESIIKEKKEDLAKIIKEKFGIEDGKKIVEEILERRLTK